MKEGVSWGEQDEYIDEDCCFLCPPLLLFERQKCSPRKKRKIKLKEKQRKKSCHGRDTNIHYLTCKQSGMVHLKHKFIYRIIEIYINKTKNVMRHKECMIDDSNPNLDIVISAPTITGKWLRANISSIIWKY